MEKAERIQKLHEYRKKCRDVLDDKNTPPDDFFTALMGWALFTDQLSSLGEKNLYEKAHTRS